MRRALATAAKRSSCSSARQNLQAGPVCWACRRQLGLSRCTGVENARQFQTTSQQRSEHERPRPPQTHYELFPDTLSAGPPPHGPFAVDVKQLRKEFLQLQARAHPDRHPPEAKRRAEATSALINEAFKVLQNPLLRAQYLLSLRGIDVAEDETAKVDDPELLGEVLETREEIEEAQGEEDLLPLKETNDARIEESVKVIDQAFREDDIGAAKQEAVKLRYWINIKESLDNWEKGKPVVLIH